MIPPSTTITAGGRRIRKTLVIAGVVLIVGNLLVTTLGRLLGGDRVNGPAGSSYVTTAFGTAGLAELLQGEGVEVSRLRAPYSPTRFGSTEVLVLVEVGVSGLADPEIRAVDGFIKDGGWIILAGAEPAGLLSALAPTDTPPEWQPEGPSSADSTLAGVDEVPLDGRGSFATWNGTEPFLKSGDGEVVGIEWARGRGRVIWLADSTPLLNKGLAGGDSAGLALSLIEDRAVVFDEYRHGFGGESFWQLLPGGWAPALGLMIVAGLAWLIAYGRRLGPPEETERKLQPERALYVESVAAILGRTKRIEESVKPIRARFRRTLAARAGIGPNASDVELKEAGMALGLTAEDVDAALDETGDPVSAGRALARLSMRRLL